MAMVFELDNFCETANVSSYLWGKTFMNKTSTHNINMQVEK